LQRSLHRISAESFFECFELLESLTKLLLWSHGGVGGERPDELEWKLPGCLQAVAEF
jgi:hypothetical protein